VRACARVGLVELRTGRVRACARVGGQLRVECRVVFIIRLVFGVALNEFGLIG